VALYKFYAPERVSVLESLTIRFTPATDFNDPFELLPSADFITKDSFIQPIEDSIAKDVSVDLAIRGVKNRSGSVADDVRYLHDVRAEVRSSFARNMRHLEKIAVSKMPNVISNIGIFCLASVSLDQPEAALMWGHYASGHRGFAIEFDEEKLKAHWPKTDSDQAIALGPVCYSEKRPSIGTDDLSAKANAFTKAKAWEYEREFRIIRRINEPDLLSDTAGKRTLLKIPGALIHGVSFGVKCDDAIKNQIVAALQVPELQHVLKNLTQAEYTAHEYRVTLRPY
jgi:Protein of unknown function (DUF2971)